MNKPLLFSFTGLDDEVTDDDILELIEINAVHHAANHGAPYIELALLIFPEKESQPRNPSKKWRDGFLSRIRNHNQLVDTHETFGLAAHLCGRAIFRNILDDHNGKLQDDAKNTHNALMQELSLYDRIQVNINARGSDFTPEQVHDVYNYLIAKGHVLILQLHQDSADYIRSYLQTLTLDQVAKHVRVLVDSSRGRGESPESWTDASDIIRSSRIPDVQRGFAGGLNENNMYRSVRELMFVNFGFQYRWWTDLESGVRTDNGFDREKLRKILQKAMDAVNHYSSKGVGFAVSDDGYAFRRIGSENEFINIRDMGYSSSEPSWCDIRSATVIVGDEQAEWLLHHLNERASVSDHPYRLELVVVRNTHSVIQTL